MSFTLTDSEGRTFLSGDVVEGVLTVSFGGVEQGQVTLRGPHEILEAGHTLTLLADHHPHEFMISAHLHSGKPPGGNARDRRRWRRANRDLLEVLHG